MSVIAALMQASTDAVSLPWDKLLSIGGPAGLLAIVLFFVLNKQDKRDDRQDKRDDKVLAAIKEQHDACNATQTNITATFAKTVEQCQESLERCHEGTTAALKEFREETQQGRKELHDLIREMKR